VLRRADAVVAVLRRPRLLAALAGTAALIAANWLAFLWAIETGHLLQVSLGYFMNPLLNVALGAIVLRETLSRAQGAAVAIAAAGVLGLAVAGREVPWLALFLAGTFALYGLFRKLMPVDPLTGLLAETVLLWPVAVGALLWWHHAGRGAFGRSAGTDALLVLSGAVTAVPLLCFVAAARRLSLTALGFFQYLAPTLQFLIAVLLWHEPFSGPRLWAFCAIWLALGVASWDALRRSRRPPRGPIECPEGPAPG
jgi:chloramphenicol-sensitive protein RarD